MKIRFSLPPAGLVIGARARLALIAAACVLTALLLNFFVAPAVVSYGRFDARLDAAGRSLAGAEALLSKKGEIENALRRFGPASVRRAGSDETESGEFLKQVDELARVSGVRTLDYKPVQARRSESGAEYRLELTIESEANALTNFLYRLEKSAELMSVFSLKISVSPESAEQLRSTLVVTKSVL